MFEVRPARGNVIQLIGRLDAAEAETATADLRQVDGKQILDLSRLDYISSAGLGVLLELQKRLDKTGGGLKLTNIRGHVRDVFRYSGLDQVFEIVDSPVIAEEDDTGRLSIPESFRYKILEKIGEGRTGQVFMARDLSLDRRVAIKFLSEKMLENETARRRFLREARAAAALDNPFICKVLESGEAKGKLYIAMEYVEGETLATLLSTGPVAWRKGVKIAREISEALDSAHRARILHRDLRPANIMLSPANHVKIMDFGSVKPLEGAEWRAGDQTLTIDAEDQTLTLHSEYLSPEQLKGTEVTYQSDIFSFGIVLYEMLAGVHPFKQTEPAQTIVSIVSQAPAPLTRYHSGIPRGLAQIADRMLAKEPAYRYASFAEILTDLERLIEDPHWQVQSSDKVDETSSRGKRWPKKLPAWLRPKKS